YGSASQFATQDKLYYLKTGLRELQATDLATDEQSVIVMDNASNHSRRSEQIPNTGTKKADI
ncbi:hypothetical protein PPYR_15552, partial [Photinus pyralis]